MDFFIGVTDDSWYHFLAQRQPDEVNFWRPKSKVRFRAIPQGAPFLFKLHSPNNFIVGGGFFVKHALLPFRLAWEIFGEKNGATDFSSFYRKLFQYRNSSEINPEIGCIILTDPFFFPREDWIKMPPDWSKNIVQGKTYSTQDHIGANVWDQVQTRLQQYRPEPEKTDLVLSEPEKRYSVKARVGQGSFRVLVTEAYQRRCAVTGERTLPVLEAAHIKPYSESGPNQTQNGLLLRSDLHILFDKGYVTVTDDYRVKVSRLLKEEFENGKIYYVHHGSKLF